MAEYKLTNKAIEDLTKIWNYTFEECSEEQADKYYKILLENCQKIANNPNLGRNYDGIKSELFGVKANQHIIFYRKLNRKPIEITRILYGRIRITE